MSKLNMQQGDRVPDRSSSSSSVVMRFGIKAAAAAG